MFVWHSTPESVEDGVASVIGILETLGAMCLYAWAAARYGTLHLTIAACMAPLLMLQTRESMELSIRWFSNLKRHQNPIFLFICVAAAAVWASVTLVLAGRPSLQSWHPLLRLLVVVALLPAIIGFATTLPFKVAAVIRVLCHSPLLTVQQMPSRWWRVAACLDLTHPPELFLGASLWRRRYNVDSFLTPYSVIRETVDAATGKYGDVGTRLLSVVLLVPVVITTVIGLAFPAWAYRWSLKGTSIVWFPLVWTIHEFQERTPRRICESKFMAFVRAYVSRTVIMLFAVKVLYVVFGVRLAVITNNVELGTQLLRSEVTRALIAPEAFPAWQLAVVTAAVLDYLLYWFADRVRRLLKNRQS